MTSDWTKEPPTLSGYYEVCMDPESWGLPERLAKPSRIVYVDLTTGQFDAIAFGGPLQERCWKWRGPIEVPAFLPESDG